MTVVFRPLRDDELADWQAAHVEWYAADLHEHGNMAEPAAQAKAVADLRTLLPAGLETPGHVLLAVEAGGERVGSVWYAVRDDGGGEHAYLFAIEIDEARRGQGLGRAAMLALEDDVRRRGLARLSLNVFGGNERARALYRSLGFAESSVHMDKDLA
jgi:ribosomal protein S18 acetylase RimI-like enzyme